MRGIPYTNKFVMYPPRAQVSIRSCNISKYKNYIGQYKFNGTRTLLFVLPDGTIEFWSRHQEKLKKYKMTQKMERSICDLSLPLGHFHVLDGELMHSKTRGLKDRLVFFDALVYKSQYLIGSTYQERGNLLKRICGSPRTLEQNTGHGIALRAKETLWLAQSFSEDLSKRYQDHIDLDEIEGIVLKYPKGKLKFGISVKNNGLWQVRCRKKHKNYEY